MQAFPTTTVSILRGTTTTPAGDVVDSGTVHQSGIVASVMERTRTGITATDQAVRVFHYTVCRLPAGTDVLDTDQIKDERTGKIYSISAVSVLSSPVHTPDLRLDLQHIN